MTGMAKTKSGSGMEHTGELMREWGTGEQVGTGIQVNL